MKVNKVLDAFLESYLNCVGKYSEDYTLTENKNSKFVKMPKEKSAKETNSLDSKNANVSERNNTLLKRKSDNINYERH